MQGTLLKAGHGEGHLEMSTRKAEALLAPSWDNPQETLYSQDNL